MSDEGRLVAGRYRLLQRIGSGAMGVVWQAHDERLHRTVAVKELLLQPGLSREEADEAKQRAMREGRIAARLQHPNAVTVFDVVEEDGAPCLVMEYLASRSLAAVMAERGTLAPVEAARIGAQVASALTAAHVAGIVHRDIKPGNILLSDDGTVKITDFGISRATGDVTVTKTGMLAGTPAYLAPEVARGRDIGPPSDVFSLGSTLYAAVEGEPPFGLNENTLALLHAVAAGKVSPPSQAGPLTALLMRLLRSEPEERPTMGQAREALAAVAAGKPLPAGLGEAVAVVPPWQSGAPTQAVVTKAVPSLASPAEPRPATARPTPPPTSVSPLPATGAEERPESRPWYRRAGLLYGTSVVLAVATGIVVTNLIMAHNRQTGDASAFPTSSDARHTASAPGGPPEQSADGRPQAPPRISSTGPSSTPTSSSPSPTPTTTPKHDGDGQEDRVEAVSDYYELLPGNTDAAWSRLTPNARNKTQGLASYRSWWAGVKSIDVAEHAAAGGGVRAKLVYHMRDGRVVEDDMTFTLVQQGESYLIDDWQLLGSRKVG